MRWLASFAARTDAVFAVLGVALFVAALASGIGIKSFAFLGAAIWWLLLSRYWAGQAHVAARHRELRGRRLERERQGMAPPRD